MQTHILDRETIAQTVARKKIGNYWLGYFAADGSFLVRYVGRSDTCLQRRLLEHASNGKYDVFHVRMAGEILEGFDIECREWHLLKSLGQLDNRIHPDAPSKLPYACLYCRALQCSSCPLDEKVNLADEFVGGEA